MTPRAPRICSEVGCSALVRDPKRRKCEIHYRPSSKHGSDIQRSDTKSQRQLRARVFGQAGYRWQLAYVRICTGIAEVLDRIDNQHGYESHNLQAACQSCSQAKSSREGHLGAGHAVEMPTRSDTAAQPAPSTPKPSTLKIPRRIELWPE
jgi:hypothetical protein